MLSTQEAVRLAAERTAAAADAYQAHLAADDMAAARCELHQLALDLERILAETETDGTVYPVIALELIGAYQELWLIGDTQDCLHAAIRHTRAALAVCQDAAAARELKMGLAVSLAESADADGTAGGGTDDEWAGGPDDAFVSSAHHREEAIEILAGLVAEIEPDDPMLPDAASMLGRLRYARHCDRRRAEAEESAELDGVIDPLMTAASIWESGGQEPDPDALIGLIMALSERHSARGDAGDADSLIAWGERYLTLPSATDAGAELVHDLLADNYLDRAQRQHGPSHADLDAAILHYQAVLAAGDEEQRAGTCAFLAHACWLRLDGDCTDYAAVDQMTAYAEQAWRLLPADDPVRAEVGFYLATGIHERLRRDGEPFDLAAADLSIEVLTKIEPDLGEHQDLHLIAIVLLGTCLVGRGQVTGSAADIAAAQPWLLRAAGELPVGDPAWAEMTLTLAAAMTGVAWATMEGEHLDRMIELLASVIGLPTQEQDRMVAARAVYGTALAQRAVSSGDQAELDLAITQLRRAFELVPDNGSSRLDIAWNLGSALLVRFNLRGGIEDLDAAEFYLSAATPRDDGTMAALRQRIVDADIVVTGMRGMLKAVRAQAGKPELFDDAIADLRAALALAPPGNAYHERIKSDLGLTLLMRSGVRGNVDDRNEGMIFAEAAANALPVGHRMRPYALLRAAGAQAAAGLAAKNADQLRGAVGRLRSALGELDPSFGNKNRFSGLLGGCYESLHQLTGDPADLDAAERWLAIACEEFGTEHGHPLLAETLMRLARVRRRQADTVGAVRTGRTALRERGRDVLLQTGAAHALSRASAAAAEAAEVGSWCLADGDVDAAVEALELGRGLVLHAATSVAQLPEMLDNAGRDDLADRWRAMAANPAAFNAPWVVGTDPAGYARQLLAEPGELLVPDDLRAQVLAALAGIVRERLLAPPGPGPIADALASTRADALIYLVGPDGAAPGRAIVVRAAGDHPCRAEMIDLPLLRPGTDGVLDAYAQAQAAMLAAEGGGTREQDAPLAASRWRDALGAMCEWAWPMVMRPVLAHVRQWSLNRPPRLVLVPTGRLSMVPWHATSRQASGSRPRYACQDAVISYAASGRQLVELSRRPVLPLRQNAAVIGNPTRQLVFSAIEAQAIRDACYPGAQYYGYVGPRWNGQASGPGSGREVLALLPSADRSGASMIHLGCHANVVGGAPGKSFLSLAGGEELTVEDILRQASGRTPEAPGGLISIGACRSDLAASEHDEALALSTAFLAAGAVTVVGARWQVADGSSSLQLFMIHHFMTAGGHPPMDACWLAQQWMLDPGRQPPTAMPRVLAVDAGKPELADVTVWAALTHQGR